MSCPRSCCSQLSNGICHFVDLLFLFPHKSLPGDLELACMTAASRWPNLKFVFLTPDCRTGISIIELAVASASPTAAFVFCIFDSWCVYFTGRNTSARSSTRFTQDVWRSVFPRRISNPSSCSRDPFNISIEDLQLSREQALLTSAGASSSSRTPTTSSTALHRASDAPSFSSIQSTRIHVESAPSTTTLFWWTRLTSLVLREPPWK